MLIQPHISFCLYLLYQHPSVSLNYFKEELKDFSSKLSVKQKCPRTVVAFVSELLFPSIFPSILQSVTLRTNNIIIIEGLQGVKKHPVNIGTIIIS